MFEPICPARRALLGDCARASALGLALAAGLIKPSRAQTGGSAWNKAAFESKDLGSVLKVFGAVPAPVETDQIALVGPDIAEDGAAVPLSVTSRLPETEEISILIENNPNLLAVMFSLPEMTDGELVTRVKMAGTSDIYALVKAGGSWYFAKTHVKVTIGGCGD